MLDFIGLCVTPALLFYRNWQDYILNQHQNHHNSFVTNSWIKLPVIWIHRHKLLGHLLALTVWYWHTTCMALKKPSYKVEHLFLDYFHHIHSFTHLANQTNKQTDKQTNKQTNRQTDKQTNRDMISNSSLLRLWCIYSCQVSLLLHRKDPTGEPGNDKNQCL